jgi:predicted DNA-binding protein
METHSQAFTISLPAGTASNLEDVARHIGLPRATVARKIIEKWLSNPAPLFDLPRQQSENSP